MKKCVDSVRFVSVQDDVFNVKNACKKNKVLISFTKAVLSKLRGCLCFHTKDTKQVYSFLEWVFEFMVGKVVKVQL